MKLDILAFGAHPDDVELELWSNHCQRNFFREKVGIIDLTRGELGTRGSAELEIKKLQMQQKLLGVL